MPAKSKAKLHRRIKYFQWTERASTGWHEQRMKTQKAIISEDLKNGMVGMTY